MNDSHGSIQNMDPGLKQNLSICSNGMTSCGIQSSDRYSLEGWRSTNKSDSTYSDDSDAFIHNWGIPDQLGDKYVVICGRSSTETESKAARNRQLSMSSYEGRSYSCSYESFYTDDSSIRSEIASTEISSSSESDESFSPTRVVEAMQAMWRDNPAMSYTTSDSQSLTDRIGDLSPADQLALISMLEMDTIPSSSDDDETIDSKCGDATYCGNRLHRVLNNHFFAVDECNERIIRMVDAAKENRSNDQNKRNWLVPFVPSEHSSFHDSSSSDEDDRCSTSTDAQGNHTSRNVTSVTWWDEDCKIQAKNEISDCISSMNELMDQVGETEETASDQYDADRNVTGVGKVQIGLCTSGDDVSTAGNKQDSLITNVKPENGEGRNHTQDILEPLNDPSNGRDSMEGNVEDANDLSEKNIGDEKEFINDSAQVQGILKMSHKLGQTVNANESLELNQDSFFTSMEGSFDQVRNASDTSEDGLSFETEEDTGISHPFETQPGDEDHFKECSNHSVLETSDDDIGMFESKESLGHIHGVPPSNSEEEFKDSSDQTRTLSDSHEDDESSFTTQETLEEEEAFLEDEDALGSDSGSDNESEESLDQVWDTQSYETERSRDDDVDNLEKQIENKDGYDTENSLLDHTHECLDHILLEHSQGTLTNVEVKENEQTRETDLRCKDDYQVPLNENERSTDDGQQSSQLLHGERLSHMDTSLPPTPKHADTQSTFGLVDFFTPLLTLCNRKKEAKVSISKNSNDEIDPEEKDSRTITLLYSAIRNHDAEGALACLKRFPEECRTWVTCCDTISNERTLISSPQRLKYLPLHTACLSRSPLHLVKEIIRIYPDAIKKRAGNYKYPIHMACDAGVDPDVMCCLIKAWPESIYARDGDNNIPLCALLQNKPLSPDQDAIMMILLASFQELQESQAEFTKWT